MDFSKATNKDLARLLLHISNEYGVRGTTKEVIDAIAERLAADDWTPIIDADGREIEGALPPNYNELLYCIAFPDGATQTVSGYFNDGIWYLSDNRKLKESYRAIPYAYKPWPDPAPWPVEE